MTASNAAGNGREDYYLAGDSAYRHMNAKKDCSIAILACEKSGSKGSIGRNAGSLELTEGILANLR